MRYFFAAEERGELPKGTAKRWAEETKNIKSLPERVSDSKKKNKSKKSNYYLKKLAELFRLFGE